MMPRYRVGDEWVYIANPDEMIEPTDDKPLTREEEMANASKKDGNRDNVEVYQEAGKEFIETEQKILVGKLKIRPNFAVRARNTIRLEGLGQLLSGLYYVDRAVYVFSESGVSQELEVKKNAFGETLETINRQGGTTLSPTVTAPTQDTTPTTPIDNGDTDSNQDNSSDITEPQQPEEAIDLPTDPIATYTVKSGDSLSSIAKKYYGSGASKYWKAIYFANQDVIGSNPNLIYPNTILKIPPKP